MAMLVYRRVGQSFCWADVLHPFPWHESTHDGNVGPPQPRDGFQRGFFQWIQPSAAFKLAGNHMACIDCIDLGLQKPTSFPRMPVFPWSFLNYPYLKWTTLPETNIFAPENRPLEKEIPIGNHHFQGRTLSFRECNPGKTLLGGWVNSPSQPRGVSELPHAHAINPWLVAILWHLSWVSWTQEPCEFFVSPEVTSTFSKIHTHIANFTRLVAPTTVASFLWSQEPCELEQFVGQSFARDCSIRRNFGTSEAVEKVTGVEPMLFPFFSYIREGKEVSISTEQKRTNIIKL